MNASRSYLRPLPALLAIVVLTGLPAFAQVVSRPTIDTTLTPHPGARLPVASQADGKLLVSGDTFVVGGANQKGLARLNADWTLDTGFAIGTGADASQIKTLVVQADQKVMVGGTFTSFSGQALSGLVRLLPDGRLDPTFAYDGPAVIQVTPLATGDYLVIDGSAHIRRHAPNGQFLGLLPKPVQIVAAANRFQHSTITARSVAQLKDGTVLGAFQIMDPYPTPLDDPHSNVTKLRTYSRIVCAFGHDGQQRTDWPVIEPVAPLLTDAFLQGEVVQILPESTGGFYLLSSGPAFTPLIPAPAVKHYHADGSVDPSFNVPPLTSRSWTTLTGAFDSSGRLVISGARCADPANPKDILTTMRLTEAGAIDPTFGIAAPNPDSSAMLFGTVRLGLTASEDRMILFDQGALVAIKPTNTLSLGSASLLPERQGVTAGKSSSLAAIGAGTNIQWQISTDGGHLWSNLADGASYRGTHTPTLDLLNLESSQNGALFRFISTTSRGSVASNAAQLKVSPALFPLPSALALDGAGNIYVADAALHTIQKIDAASRVSLVAGASGQTGSVDGLDAAARFNQPGGLHAATDGALHVSDSANGTIRTISRSGLVGTLTGSSSSRGSTDGPAGQALFSLRSASHRPRTAHSTSPTRTTTPSAKSHSTEPSQPWPGPPATPAHQMEPAPPRGSISPLASRWTPAATSMSPTPPTT